MSDETTSPWGRVAEDGTVYVRTADGERTIGSWLAGSPAEGLAYYQRRYADIVAEVALLEKRVAAGDPRSVLAATTKLKESLPEAHVIGDLAALQNRLDALLAAAQERADQHRAARAERTQQANAAKAVLVEEAESLANSTDWKIAGDRLRTILEEWKAVQGADRKVEGELWKRYAAARDTFNKHRSEHFSGLDQQRKQAQIRKEAIVTEAEALAESTDWVGTANRLRELMADWKSAGRAPRALDDALWARFRSAQDAFYGRRAAAWEERDAAYRGNQERKEALLAEAEGLDPEADLNGVQRRLREIQDEWERAGRVPRNAIHDLDRRMTAVEDRVRAVADRRWRQANAAESPLVIRLRESVTKLEKRLERARAAGKDAEAATTEATLTTQREWLAQAERGGS